MATPAQPATPSLMEIMQAVQMMHPQSPVSVGPVQIDKEAGVTKLIVGGVVAFIGVVMMAVCLWVGSSVNSLSTSVTKMSANVDQLQKSITDLQQTQGTASQQLADGKATDARQDARLESHDAEFNRMKERMRIVEGQPPLRGSQGGQ